MATAPARQGGALERHAWELVTRKFPSLPLQQQYPVYRSGLLLHKFDPKGPNFAIEVTSTTTHKMRQLRENIVPAAQEAGIPHLAIYVRMDRPVHSSFRRDLPAGVTLLETDQQLIAWIESVSGMEPTE